MDPRYRKACLEDLDAVMAIIEDGRAFLKPQGGGQWQNGYPTREDLKRDIQAGICYVILTPADQIAATLSLSYHENDYDHLYQGRWLSDEPYMVLHRCAVKKEHYGRGFGLALFQVFEIEAKRQGYRSLRIDTHENNLIMRHLLEKSGFVFCGKAILTPDKDRMVFEKLL